MIHNVININDKKEREKTIVGMKGSEKLSIATNFVLNISKNIAKHWILINIWSELDYGKILNL